MKGRDVFALVMLFLLLTGAASAGRSDRWIASFGHPGEKPGELNGPYDLDVGPDGNLYISDANNHRIQKWNPEGKSILVIGKEGNGAGEFDAPSGIAIDSKGNAYVVDTYNHRVQKFTSDGKFLLQWGEKKKVNNVRSALNFLWDEDLEGKFYHPAKITISSMDEIYVADSYNNRVQVFSPDGRFLRKWGGMGLWGGLPGGLGSRL